MSTSSLYTHTHKQTKNKIIILNYFDFSKFCNNQKKKLFLILEKTMKLKKI